MKHYFIHRKGNDSEKLVKTPRSQRKTIKYHRYHEDCIEVFEIEPGVEGITEEDIRQFKAKYGYEPHPADVDDAAKGIFPRNWIASLDEILDGDGDNDSASGDKSAILAKAYRPSGSEPGIMEKMDEIASTWPDSWQEIYERVLKNHETIVSLARERGVSEGAVRKTYNKILKTLGENPELRKSIRLFD